MGTSGYTQNEAHLLACPLILTFPEGFGSYLSLSLSLSLSLVAVAVQFHNTVDRRDGGRASFYCEDSSVHSPLSISISQGDIYGEVGLLVHGNGLTLRCHQVCPTGHWAVRLTPVAHRPHEAQMSLQMQSVYQVNTNTVVSNIKHEDHLKIVNSAHYETKSKYSLFNFFISDLAWRTGLVCHSLAVA